MTFSTAYNLESLLTHYDLMPADIALCRAEALKSLLNGERSLAENQEKYHQFKLVLVECLGLDKVGWLQELKIQGFSFPDFITYLQAQPSKSEDYEVIEELWSQILTHDASDSLAFLIQEDPSHSFFRHNFSMLGSNLLLEAARFGSVECLNTLLASTEPSIQALDATQTNAHQQNVLTLFMYGVRKSRSEFGQSELTFQEIADMLEKLEYKIKTQCQFDSSAEGYIEKRELSYYWYTQDFYDRSALMYWLESDKREAKKYANNPMATPVQQPLSQGVQVYTAQLSRNFFQWHTDKLQTAEELQTLQRQTLLALPFILKYNPGFLHQNPFLASDISELDTLIIQKEYEMLDTQLTQLVRVESTADLTGSSQEATNVQLTVERRRKI